MTIVAVQCKLYDMLINSLFSNHDNDFLVLQDGLRENFAKATVSVVDCPDLKQEPFMLAASGKCTWPVTRIV